MPDITLQLQATPSDDGFDILAITEGEAQGHAITFSSAVLQEAMPLYDGIPVFVDHAGLNEHQSVRNLAGTLHMPTWNDLEHGIQLKLKPAGPASQVLIQLRDAARTEPAIMKTVGFSSVVNVQLNKSREVTKILRVRSTDVVINPARGGKFLSALTEDAQPDPDPHHTSHMNPARYTKNPKEASGVKGEKTMTDPIQPTEQAELTAEAIIDPESSQVEAPPPSSDQMALDLQQAHALIASLQDIQRQALAVQLEQCRSLLDTALAASKLPAAAQKVVRRPFDRQLDEGTPFLAAELQQAIQEKREELAELTEGASIQGPARSSSITGMFTGLEQFKAALADLFGAPRDPGTESLKVRPLRGIQEAYLLATGDINFMGGYYPEIALVTANFPAITADLLNKVLLNAWEDYSKVYGWWQKVVTVEHFTNLQDVKWLKTGTIASLPIVAERGEYTELPIGDNKESSEWGKYGGYIPLTIEAVLKDDVRAFRRMPKEVALAGIRNISEQVAAIFTQNSGAGPTLADGGALFNATVTTTAGGHANLRTIALDASEWKAIRHAMFKQALLVKNAAGKYGTGKASGIYPKYLLVPVDLVDIANDILLNQWLTADNKAAHNLLYGTAEPITIPEWTDANNHAAVIDPNLIPGVMIGEIFGVKPQIFSASSELDPAMFANDESRLKVRQFLNVGVADFRPLHKSNVP